jgi:hypothetical protein
MPLGPATGFGLCFESVAAALWHDQAASICSPPSAAQRFGPLLV